MSLIYARDRRNALTAPMGILHQYDDTTTRTNTIQHKKLHVELECSICMVATYINVSLHLQMETHQKKSRKRDRQKFIYNSKAPTKTTQDISAEKVKETKVAEQAVGEQGSKDEQQGKKKMRVMVAIDESEWSFYALKWALDHLFVGPNDKAGVAATLEAPAGSQENVSMATLVHVMPPFYNYVLPAGPGGAAYYVTPALLESVRKAQEDGAADVVSSALEMCKDKMIKAETLILRGDPKDMICEATEQRYVDLLVVGSRGLGMVKRAFLGSVSDYCAHHAKCPVVIVKPPKETGKK